MRAHSQHLSDLASLDGDDYVEHSRDTGVNHHSVLTDMKYVDICSGILLPDVMHDILGKYTHTHVCTCTHMYTHTYTHMYTHIHTEGTLQYETKLILKL